MKGFHGMLKKNEIIALLTLVCCAFGVAAQDYRLTLNIVLDTDPAVQSEAPLSVKKPSDPVRIDWIEMQGVGLQIPKATPHDAHIYYSRTPNGGDTSKYTRINIMDTGTASMTPNVNKKYIRFVPEANNIGAGAYYCIIAYVADSVTFYSNYFELKVASPNAPILKDPKGLMGSIKEINELTPVFSWDPVEGVPYYHVVLSDEQLPFDSIITGGEIKLDLSIVWQAITPNTRITYGAPDPSNTITASPPPLSPGKEYSWLVFNNYGNHTAFSDGNAFDVPGAFRIRGDTLKTPRVVSPINNTEESGDKITFSWTDLDDRANSYLVNLFFNTTPQDLGVGELNQLDANASASMLVWETTVSRGAGNILSVDLLNAKGTLTGGNYVWRVYALDSRGAATTGDISKGAFKYAGVSSGKVAIKTFELVAGEESGIGYVELKSEVISGPMQAPLAFYTLADGYLERDFPEGTYRITAVKDGYNAQTVTFSVTGGSTTPVRIYMRRPDAVIYGRVAGPDNAAVNLAKVTAVSEWGDTVAAMTNGSGNFTLNCRAADWTVTIEKAGYRVPRSKDTTLRQGDNVNIGTIYLERNPNTLSGVVRNSTGVPVIGAKVRVLREGVLVEELASTPQNGAYSFALMSGTYTLTAEKPGFAMYSRTVNLTGSRNQDITIADSAALINGVVIGERWKSQRFGGGDDYDYAPIPNAKVTFISVVSSSSERPDTFTVTSDATFGKFSLSVSGGKTFKVMAEASGFVDISGSTAPTITTKADSTITFNDTLRALAMIKGNVTGDAVADVDIIVYDTSKNMVAASTKSSNDGSFEIRNIPDGNYIINAGKSEYYLSKDGFNDGLNVDNGRPEPSFYTLTMLSGNKTITWNVTGYNGRGSIKVTSPLNKTIPFSRGTVAVLESVGPGDYIIEAVAEADTTLLQLSYNKFRVESEDSFTSEVRFPLSHRSADSLARGGGGGVTVKIAWVGSWSSDVKKSELFYRSEGSAQYSVQPSQSDDKFSFAVTPDRDGCDLQYYFRVYLENGDIYGSAKQIFTSYVKPSANIISRIDVEPGSSGDTLYMPSSYAAPFAFKAFYSDQFIPFGESVNFGSVAWSVVGSGASVSGSGRNATLTTGAQKSDFVLRAVLTPSSGYTLKNGKARDTVAIPVNVTGSRLKGVAVIRNGGSGPVSNTEKTSFRVEASDTTGKSVTVSPLWSITPETAGKVGVDGLFQPKPDFFGVVRVYAEVGGKRAEYAEAGAGLPGLSVNYPLRNKTVEDTASTHRGLRLAFPVNSIPSGESVELHAVIHSTSGDLKNSVHRGSGGFRMADSLSYDVEFSRVNVVDSVVSIIIDVPAHLRQDAAKAPDNFKVARWYPDSLKWITLPSSEVISGGAAVAAKLSRDAKDSHINANRNNGKLGKKAKMLMKSAAGKAKSDVGAASESQLYASARYAVVIQSSKLSVDLAVSPNPFSPYIRPFREYGRYYASRSVVPPGTCIRVSIEAPESSVRSLKVHVYNATGKRVWAVDKFNAEVGENRIWWDGRTTSREEMWDDESFLEKNRDKGRMCRNGRYFVTVIVTDIEGRQQRAMKPLVLMK
jgi:hypothetical protein